MGREFVELFDRWAESYDATVYGNDPEYADVFAGYTSLLESVTQKSRGTVLEFGVGTGNLTEMLVQAGRNVIGVEPSGEMRKLASKRLPKVSIVDGDLLDFTIPTSSVDSIVSTYVFHHLTDDEKWRAIRNLNRYLPIGGLIVFADTAFSTEDEKSAAITRASRNKYLSLADDLSTEYYTTLGTLSEIFQRSGFDVSFSKWNDFVWVVEAVKTKDIPASELS